MSSEEAYSYAVNMTDAQSGSLSDIDPVTILLHFMTPAGETEVSFKMLDQWLYRQCQGSIIQGVRIGAFLITMLALFLIMKDRKAPLFIINQLTLFFSSLKSIFYLYYYLSNSGSITFQFSGYYNLTDNNRNLTAATNVTQILIVICLECAFCFQAYAMYKANQGIQRVLMLTLLTICITLGLVTISFYINSVVFALKATFDESLYSNYAWQLNVPFILFLSSVCFTSACLIAKFLYAFKQRKDYGRRQFSGIHALFIMTCQTMIIPVCVNIFSYCSPLWKSNGIPEIAYFITTIFLPLSAMWATSANNSVIPSSANNLRFVSSEDKEYDYEESFRLKDLENIQDVITINTNNDDILNKGNELKLHITRTLPPVGSVDSSTMVHNSLLESFDEGSGNFIATTEHTISHRF